MNRSRPPAESGRATEGASGAPTSRERWEHRWAGKTGPEFDWYRPDPPVQLRELLERGECPTGAALDVGCGSGVMTAYLATYFRPAVGVDIAHAAVAQAHATDWQGSTLEFAVAEVPLLPFRDQSFALVFDRGCLQNVDRRHWAEYFREVARLLRPGGLLQLFCSTPAGAGGPTWLPHPARRWWAGLSGGAGAGKAEVSAQLIRSLLDAALAVRALEEFPFELAAGRQRRVVYGLFEKRR